MIIAIVAGISPDNFSVLASLHGVAAVSVATQTTKHQTSQQIVPFAFLPSVALSTGENHLNTCKGFVIHDLGHPAGKTSSASQPVNLPQEPQIRHYTLDEIAEFQKNPDIQEMLFVVETYIRHPFSENDINTILFWHEDLHFSAELIVYLVEYCVSKGHTNLRYLNKVALAWHEKKITSVEQAKSEAAVRSKAYYAVMKAFGITGRNLIDSETAMIRKWTKEYAFDLSLIQEACARTISSTGQSSFSYADSILTSWYNDKVHSLEDVKRLDATHQQKKKERAAVKANAAASPKKNNFNNFESRENDYKSLEAMLLNSPIRS